VKMEPSTGSHPFLLERTIEDIKNSEGHPVGSGHDFIAFEWNTLNAELAYPKSFPKVPEEYLKYDFRKTLIEKELKAAISHGADFICLQEVHRQSLEFFTSVFSAAKYEVIFNHKNGGLDGVLTAFNSEKYLLTQSHASLYIDPITKEQMAHLYHANLFQKRKQPLLPKVSSLQTILSWLLILI